MSMKSATDELKEETLKLLSLIEQIEEQQRKIVETIKKMGEPILRVSPLETMPNKLSEK